MSDQLARALISLRHIRGPIRVYNERVVADDSAGVSTHPGGGAGGAENIAPPSASDASALRRPARSFLALRHEPSRIATVFLGLAGAGLFVGIWEAGHYLTPEEGRQFLPSVREVIQALADLFVSKALREQCENLHFLARQPGGMTSRALARPDR